MYSTNSDSLEKEPVPNGTDIDEMSDDEEITAEQLKKMKIKLKQILAHRLLKCINDKHNFVSDIVKAKITPIQKVAENTAFRRAFNNFHFFKVTFMFEVNVPNYEGWSISNELWIIRTSRTPPSLVDQCVVRLQQMISIRDLKATDNDNDNEISSTNNNTNDDIEKTIPPSVCPLCEHDDMDNTYYFQRGGIDLSTALSTTPTNTEDTTISTSTLDPTISSSPQVDLDSLPEELRVRVLSDSHQDFLRIDSIQSMFIFTNHQRKQLYHVLLHHIKPLHSLTEMEDVCEGLMDLQYAFFTSAFQLVPVSYYSIDWTFYSEEQLPFTKEEKECIIGFRARKHRKGIDNTTSALSSITGKRNREDDRYEFLFESTNEGKVHHLRMIKSSGGWTDIYGREHDNYLLVKRKNWSGTTPQSNNSNNIHSNPQPLHPWNHDNNQPSSNSPRCFYCRNGSRSSVGPISVVEPEYPLLYQPLHPANLLSRREFQFAQSS